VISPAALLILIALVGLRRLNKDTDPPQAT